MTPRDQSIPYGYCHCDCGQKAPLSPVTRRKRGWIKGQPLLYILGHNARQARPNFSDAAPFKIHGVYCKLVPLTRGLFAIVRACDWPLVQPWNWYAQASEDRCGYYACRRFKENGKRVTVYMHRFLLGLGDDDPRIGEHRSGDGLDNRLYEGEAGNLRLANRSQNLQNAQLRGDNKSGYKGVSWCRQMRQFRACIKIDGKQVCLGYRPIAKEAHEELYVPAALRHHGKFARTR